MENKLLFNYIDEDQIDEDLICCVCHQPFVNPKQHIDCGNVFCHGCIQQVKNCPLCRKQLNGQLSPVPKMITRKLDDIEVICPDCNEIKKRADLENHVANCAKECSIGCKQKIKPIDLKSHEGECPEKIVCCPAVDVMCPWTGKRVNREIHFAYCLYSQLRPAFTILLIKIAKLENQNEYLMNQINAKPSKTTQYNIYFAANAQLPLNDPRVQMSGHNSYIVTIQCVGNIINCKSSSHVL